MDHSCLYFHSCIYLLLDFLINNFCKESDVSMGKTWHADALINQGQVYSRMRRKGFSEGWAGSREKGRHLQSDDLGMCPAGLLSFIPSCVILCLMPSLRSLSVHICQQEVTLTKVHGLLLEENNIMQLRQNGLTC